MEGEIEEDRRKDAGDDGKHDIADAEDSRGDFHPFPQAAKNSAHHWCAVSASMTIELFHVFILPRIFSERQTFLAGFCRNSLK